MKKIENMKNIGLSFLFVLFALGSGTALANPPQPPDIRVTVQGPATAVVNSPYQYTVNVRNIGGTKANGVSVGVEFPETNTSPQVFILGTVSGIGSGCQMIGRRLQCSAGNLNPNGSRNFTFNFTYPVSTKPLEIKATGSSTSANEANPTNNIAMISPTIGYATNQITSANVLVSLCTGTNLTSYIECEKFPSSIQFFYYDAGRGGTILNLPVAGYTGNWTQIQTTNQPFQQLQFTITETSTGDSATFNGFASTSTCFEGITTFTPASGYLSPYKVCVQ